MPHTKDQHAGIAAQAVFALLVPLVVLPIALAGGPVAGIVAAALMVLILVPLIGLRPIGNGLFFAGFATVPLNDVHPIASLSYLELSDAFFVVALPFLLPRFLTTPLRMPAPLLVGGIGFATLGVLSAASGEQFGDNFAHLLDVGRSVLLLPILILWWQPGLQATIVAASAYLVGNAINVVASFGGTRVGDRAVGLTTHPNALGTCAALGVAFVPFLLGTVPPKFRWLVWCGAFVSMYGVWISGSRTSLVVVVLLAALYPVLSRSIPAALAIVALFFPAIVLVNHAAQNLDASNALGRLLGAGSAGASSAKHREGTWEGIEQVLNHPLLGDGWLRVWYAHNIYVEVAASIGLVGLACFLMILAPMIRPLVAIPQPYGLLAAPAFVAAMIGLTDPALGARYIWAAAALGLNAQRLAALANEQQPNPDVPGGLTALRPQRFAASGDASAPRA